MTRRHPYAQRLDATRLLLMTLAHITDNALERITNQANDEHDGYPTTTPANGTIGAGHGRTITVPDEHGQPDQIPVTTVEAAVIARTTDHRHPTASNVLDDIGEWTLVLHTAAQRLVHLYNNHGGEPVNEKLLRRLRCTTCETRIADPARQDGQCLECGTKHDRERARIEQNRRIRRRTA